MSTYYLSPELKKRLMEIKTRRGYKNVSQTAQAMISLGLKHEKEIPSA